MLACLPACGGGDPEASEPKLADALPFTNGFVERVVGGEDVAGESSAEIAPELRRLQESLARDGVRKVEGSGQIRGDCPENPIVDAGRDCIVYRLSGARVRPVAESQPIEATFRVWVRPADGGWEIHNYTYDARDT